MACALKSEKQALDMRALQSELMVSALSCGERDNYNQFVKEHKDYLIKNSTLLKSYFQRNYHSSAEFQMNKFITELANASSRKSLGRYQEGFCESAKEIFHQVQSVKVNKISDIASKEEFSSMHNIVECN